jgi:hypothetical protein
MRLGGRREQDGLPALILVNIERALVEALLDREPPEVVALPQVSGYVALAPRTAGSRTAPFNRSRRRMVMILGTDLAPILQSARTNYLLGSVYAGCGKSEEVTGKFKLAAAASAADQVR